MYLLEDGQCIYLFMFFFLTYVTILKAEYASLLRCGSLAVRCVEVAVLNKT